MSLSHPKVDLKDRNNLHRLRETCITAEKDNVNTNYWWKTIMDWNNHQADKGA